ncbi:SUMF1/EgtB/PvdO family nonheme iron enzyme [Bradyrhizobium sp. SYSU BS000235]|uniref:SUMF1/EgtB/PvdO family nonheme iron enzyme n=1 Tax=Bradyrhizobium sp. SYSU BS000235 TaxID=3411332 RepID=UPI003C739EA6
MRGEIHHFRTGNDGEHPHDASPRRLAAIIAGDIAGYSRLMQLDEDGTYARVKRIERDLIEPTILEHHGRLVKTTGDGFIAIFDSPVEAVRCAIVIQQSMVGRNASQPRESSIVYRIGVNLGDVIVESEDVYGDGVNVASRLEGIANPGQIFISGGIYEQVKHKLVCGYQSLGDKQVKNITDPVRVYRVLPDPSALIESRIRPLAAMLVAATVVFLSVAGGAFWYFVIKPRDQMIASRVPATAPLQAPVPTPLQAPAETAKAPPALPPSETAKVPAITVTPPLSQAKPMQTAPVPQATPVPQAAPAAPPAVATAPAAITPPPAAAKAKEPDMVPLNGGGFTMGSNDDLSERPIHRVSVKPFSMSKTPITVREWNACAAAKACSFTATGRDDAPITDVSWNDAKQFVAWLSQETKKPYRLPSEAEWEYAARGGTQTIYWWGDQFQNGIVNCRNCLDTTAEQPLNVGSLKPNPFGLHDMGGGVDQWVEDCWHKNYQGAPSDGSAWTSDGDCTSRVIRSGSWRNDARSARPASRDRYDAVVRYPTHGFRVALSREDKP